MGEYTSAVCYRAGGEPPIVTAADLARFIERIVALDILQGNKVGVSLKFGQSIDQDDRPIYGEEQLGAHSFLALSAKWNVDEERLEYKAALALLTNPSTQWRKWLNLLRPKEKLGSNVYRAHLSFGMMKEEVYKPICHELEGNWLQLTDLDFWIHLVELNDPQETGVFQAGWMECSINGNGYLFPWTYEETLDKLRHHPALNQIRDICRDMWPTKNIPPHPEVIKARPKMGKLWAEPVDAPDDWYWAINESY